MTPQRLIDALRINGESFANERMVARLLGEFAGHHTAAERVRCGNVVRAVRYQLSGDAFVIITAALTEIERGRG